MGTTALGIAYPSLTDDVRPPEDMQALAEDVDGLITIDRTARDAAATSYTPSLTGTTSGTWTAGNATLNAGYIRHGRRIKVWGQITIGSTTSLASISGSLQVSLPVAMKSGHPEHIGTGMITDASPSNRYPGIYETSGTTNMLFVRASDGQIATNAAPVATAYATGDTIRWEVEYEAASA